MSSRRGSCNSRKARLYTSIPRCLPIGRRERPLIPPALTLPGHFRRGHTLPAPTPARRHRIPRDPIPALILRGRFRPIRGHFHRGRFHRVRFRTAGDIISLPGRRCGRNGRGTFVHIFKGRTAGLLIVPGDRNGREISARICRRMNPADPLVRRNGTEIVPILPRRAIFGRHLGSVVVPVSVLTGCNALNDFRQTRDRVPDAFGGAPRVGRQLNGKCRGNATWRGIYPKKPATIILGSSERCERSVGRPCRKNG